MQVLKNIPFTLQDGIIKESFEISLPENCQILNFMFDYDQYFVWVRADAHDRYITQTFHAFRAATDIDPDFTGEFVGHVKTGRLQYTYLIFRQKAPCKPHIAGMLQEFAESLEVPPEPEPELLYVACEETGELNVLGDSTERMKVLKAYVLEFKHNNGGAKVRVLTKEGKDEFLSRHQKPICS